MLGNTQLGTNNMLPPPTSHPKLHYCNNLTWPQPAQKLSLPSVNPHCSQSLHALLPAIGLTAAFVAASSPRLSTSPDAGLQLLPLQASPCCSAARGAEHSRAFLPCSPPLWLLVPPLLLAVPWTPEVLLVPLVLLLLQSSLLLPLPVCLRLAACLLSPLPAAGLLSLMTLLLNSKQGIIMLPSEKLVVHSYVMLSVPFVAVMTLVVHLVVLPSGFLRVLVRSLISLVVPPLLQPSALLLSVLLLPLLLLLVLSLALPLLVLVPGLWHMPSTGPPLLLVSPYISSSVGAFAGTAAAAVDVVLSHPSVADCTCCDMSVQPCPGVPKALIGCTDAVVVVGEMVVLQLPLARAAL